MVLGCQMENEAKLEAYTVPQHFDLSIVAQEPDLHAPVNLDFDDKGRMWVVEMTSYMPNIEGTDEESNTNKIKILEDTDGDGTMDKMKVFLDQLILPRSLLLAYGGLIYAEPPNLWFVEINDDLPGQKTLIDSTYATVGNVEHRPACLTMNIDNWIYSSTSNARYRKKNGIWIKEFTTPRGQWGLTRDNVGRLLYNDNSNLLKADRVIPNALFKNEYLKLQKNNGQNITDNQRVYPIAATAVNRGYQDDVLLENEYLKNTTSACSPHYYRNQHIPEWNDAVFVCLPEINAIKKLDIQHEGWNVSASFPEGHEYLISSDEGFRPVDIKTGPDNNIYIVDMHRGIIQHKAFMTSYLREKLLKRKLDTITEMGRILRLSPKGAQAKSMAFDLSQDPLKKLYSDNAFIRDHAQHFIVSNAQIKYIDQLKANLYEQENEIHLMHSLWTLEGLNALDENILLDLLDRDFMHVNYSALFLLSQMELKESKKIKNLINGLISKNNDAYNFLVVSFINDLSVFSEQEKANISKSILTKNINDPYIIEAVLANLPKESQIQNATEYIALDASEEWKNALEKVANRWKEDKPVYYYKANVQIGDRRTVGMSLYRTYCGVCHGVDGEGKEKLAPSLIDSEYASGSEDRLILLTLHGLSGPIHRQGKEYQFNGEMAGINNNDDLSDEDVKDILHFVRNAFASAGYSISEERVGELRSMGPAGGGSFTEGSLDSLVQKLKTTE